MDNYRDLDSATDYGSDDDIDNRRDQEEQELRTLPVIEYTLDKEAKSGEDQHAQLHDVKNTFVYHCRRCGDNYASHTELEAMPRCQNCRTDADRVKLADEVLFNGFAGMYPLFCCPTCHHHWMIKGGASSRCKMCQNKNLAPPLIKPCMFGFGWIITRFLGRTADAPIHPRYIPPRPIPTYSASSSSSSSSHDMRRSNGHAPFPGRMTPPKVCLQDCLVPA